MTAYAVTSSAAVARRAFSLRCAFGALPVAVLDAKIRSSSVPAGPGKIAESVSGKCLAIPACVEPLAKSVSVSVRQTAYKLSLGVSQRASGPLPVLVLAAAKRGRLV